MNRKIISTLMIGLILIEAGAGNIYGIFSSSDAGTSTAQFLKLGVGAKESGMGSAQVAASSDANAVYWNPAGLNGVQDMSVSFMHVNWLEDITYDWLGFAKRINAVGVFGFGVQYMGYGSIKETNEVGVHIGDFTPNDTAVTFSYARKISEIEFGGSAKYISSRIKRNADSVAFDAGARYKLKDIKLTLGAAATNIGPGLKYVSEESPLPLMIKVGCWYGISNNWDSVLDVVMPNDNEVNLGIGTEYRYKFMALRLGYNTRTKDIGGLSGLTFGAGVSYKEFRIDYSFEPYDYMGDTHRFSVIWNGMKGSRK